MPSVAWPTSVNGHERHECFADRTQERSKLIAIVVGVRHRSIRVVLGILRLRDQTVVYGIIHIPSLFPHNGAMIASCGTECLGRRGRDRYVLAELLAAEVRRVMSVDVVTRPESITG